MAPTFRPRHDLQALGAKGVAWKHTAVADKLKDSLRHAITAGELLIVAKAQVPHGQWLSWLREHCAVSERTEQFYMRVAKNRAEIEAKISEDAADVR